MFPLRRPRLAPLVALLVGALGAAPVALVSGSAWSQPLFKEAPELAGQPGLPPVAERLPRNPLLVQPADEIGVYGGRWQMGMIGKGDGLLLYRTYGYEQLVRWDPPWRRIVPNIAQSYEASADATEFTFHLRPGMRWSDGVPFTSEDILFWYEDVLTNPEMAPRHMRWMSTGGKVGRVTAPDAHTVKFTFQAPNSPFLARLASAYDTKGPTDFPKHALKRFHPRYNPDGIQAEIAAAGVQTARELFHLKAHVDHYVSEPQALLRRPLPPGAERVGAEAIPTLTPWRIDRWENGTPPHFVAVRNPYYWKIDPAGQQLPYIDELIIHHVANADGIRQLVSEGRIDMQQRNIQSNIPREDLPEIQKARGYRLFETLSAENNVLALGFNLTHRDPAKRALFANRAFRAALSEAIDRKAVIDQVFSGGQPYQPAPRPESRFFHERLARQHLAYDPPATNAALDALGLSARDGEGFRLGSDGRRVSVDLMTRRDRAGYVSAVGLIASNWQAVGIDAQVKAVERGDLNRARETNDFDVTTTAPDGGIDPVLEPQDYMPLTEDSVFGLAWVHWIEHQDDAIAEQPPPTVLRQLGLYDRIRETMDPAHQTRLMREILDIAADQFYLIGIALPPPGFGLVRDNFRNVPTFMIDSWIYPTPGPVNVCQFYIKAP